MTNLKLKKYNHLDVDAMQGLLWLVVTLIQLVDQTFQASQLNQTKRLVGVWLTDFYLHAAKQTGKT